MVENIFIPQAHETIKYIIIIIIKNLALILGTIL